MSIVSKELQDRETFFGENGTFSKKGGAKGPVDTSRHPCQRCALNKDKWGRLYLASKMMQEIH